MRNEAINALLRRGRMLFYRLLDPLDALFLWINRMSDYPPISLRRHVSCLGFLDGSGCEYVTYLRLLAGLEDGAKLLDMACGCGFLELALDGHKWRGTVVGVDIYHPAVRWCEKKISWRMPSFRFIHANIYNAAYWRKGLLGASEWFEQFDETGFDCVVAKSLFTHMLPEELSVYLAQLAARAKSGGKCLFSFFLLNPEQMNLQQTGKGSLAFTKHDDNAEYGVRLKRAPTAAVAYEEDYIRDQLDACGWENVTIYYGYWSGRSNGLDYQDLIVATKV